MTPANKDELLRSFRWSSRDCLATPGCRTLMVRAMLRGQPLAVNRGVDPVVIEQAIDGSDQLWAILRAMQDYIIAEAERREEPRYAE